MHTEERNSTAFPEKDHAFQHRSAVRVGYLGDSVLGCDARGKRSDIGLGYEPGNTHVQFRFGANHSDGFGRKEGRPAQIEKVVVQTNPLTCESECERR